MGSQAASGRRSRDAEKWARTRQQCGGNRSDVRITVRREREFGGRRHEGANVDDLGRGLDVPPTFPVSPSRRGDGSRLASDRLRSCRPEGSRVEQIQTRYGRLSAPGRFGGASNRLRLEADPDGGACRRDHARETISPDGPRRRQPKQFPARRAGHPPAGPAGSATWLAA